jgi:hypothetical protein
MPSFQRGRVTELLEARRGLQRVLIDLGRTSPERAYVLTQLTGDVEPGDHVIVNTTAVELGLGTGGWHVVHWNLARERWSQTGPGHIIKARYTSLQTDVGSSEEHWVELASVTSIDALPVVAAALHSQLPAIVLGARSVLPDARIAYVMTDGAALPIALSDLVHALQERELVDATITCGHAFGGDHEAVNVHSALAVAAHVVHADLAAVVMGPGIVGTATRLGFTGMEVGPILDAAAALGGQPIAALRASDADPRPRHRGLSHHSATALTIGCCCRARVALPAVGGRLEARLRDDLDAAGIMRRHDVVPVPPPPIIDLLRTHDLEVVSMGRAAQDDPILFESAAAAGALAAQLASARRNRR